MSRHSYTVTQRDRARSEERRLAALPILDDPGEAKR